MNKKMIIVLLSFLLISSGCAKVTTNDIDNSIKEGNYKKAVTDYKKLSEEDKEKVKIKFEENIENIKERYLKEEIDYTEAVNLISEIKSVEDMDELCNSAISVINKIKDSNEAFNNAENHFNSNEFEKALSEYSKVIKEDIKNYDSAQNKINEVTKKIEETILVKVESASIVEQSSEWKSLYPDMIQVKVLNKSTQPIKNIKIGFLAWDSNNLPIKIKSQFGFGNEGFEFIGNAESVNIMPDSIWGEGVGWNLDEAHGISTIKANVKEVEFYDGTKWTNPIYLNWIEKYKEKPL